MLSWDDFHAEEKPVPRTQPATTAPQEHKGLRFCTMIQLGMQTSSHILYGLNHQEHKNTDIVLSQETDRRIGQFKLAAMGW